jgi:hypothetical protein
MDPCGERKYELEFLLEQETKSSSTDKRIFFIGILLSGRPGRGL